MESPIPNRVSLERTKPLDFHLALGRSHHGEGLAAARLAVPQKEKRGEHRGVAT